jgi:hypothetical protein
MKNGVAAKPDRRHAQLFGRARTEETYAGGTANSPSRVPTRDVETYAETTASMPASPAITQSKRTILLGELAETGSNFAFLFTCVAIKAALIENLADGDHGGSVLFASA